MKKAVLNVDLIYPIGSYYETSNFGFNPNTHFGGKWELEEDGTILVSKSTKAGSKFNVDLETIVGSEIHTLTIKEMPSHRHSLRVVKDNETNSHGYFPKGNNSQGNNNGWADAIDTDNDNNALGYTGGNQAHNNVQPSKVVNRWHRIA